MVCKNCRRLLPQQINFCNGCGAKVIRNRLTIRNLFEDFTYRYLNYDNQLLRTFRHLFSKPEEVIGSYINGTRKKYVDVISYFAIAITLTGFYTYILTNFFPDAMTNHFLSGYSNAANKEMQAGQIDFMTKYSSLVMMSYIPIYALMAKIVFFNKRNYNFTELLVVFLYIQAQISIITSVLMVVLLALKVDFILISLLLFPLMVLYNAYCLKRLYKLSLEGIILRTLGFGAIFIAFIIISSIGFATWMFLTDTGQEMIEAQKAAIEAAKRAKN
ncbi:DUF3667 domain-containing protein [uncultured Lacinutrix sp.]|uniref:DUF3667 domain-containing protein n=1 Tax=uncultured Lacinutrix sp. TaxID=574032 RepID=UPI002617B193|nr:DUF3667 domain-containing protein [uncultured Lacinutrix sp.]